MPKKPLENLTESMFYLLMAFMRGPACGTDAAAWVREKTGGRSRLILCLCEKSEQREISEKRESGEKRGDAS